jgi:hypothetical protein
MSTTTPSTTTASAPKHIARPLADIACLVRVSDETPEDALQQALSLAVEHQAHLTLAIAAVRVATPYTPFWSGLPSSLTSELCGRRARRQGARGGAHRRHQPDRRDHGG